MRAHMNSTMIVSYATVNKTSWHMSWSRDGRDESVRVKRTSNKKFTLQVISPRWLNMIGQVPMAISVLSGDTAIPTSTANYSQLMAHDS